MGNDYVIEKEIGRGGMGCVYKGLTPDGRPTAIKMLENKYVSVPEFRFFFDSEAKALKDMNHPSVVKILGDTFSDAQGNLYLPMEYVEGETLQHHIQTFGAYSEQEARDLMCKILDAFTYIHGVNKIHRDIKPSNIMIRPDGSICVIDFGIAKDMKVSTGKTIGMTVGTDGYMSPEQISALNIDHRTDIYSLGCLLHYMLTGQHAIVKRSNDYETKLAILHNEFPSAKELRPELSDDIQKIIFKAVDKNMTQRYQTAEAFKKALKGERDAEPELKTSISGAKLTVGRLPGNDIVIENQYVSSNAHLTIYYKPMPNSPTGAILEIRDDSTNGTGVNGKYLHKGSMSFNFDLSAVEVSYDYGGAEAEILYTGGVEPLPEVLLAGRPELRLDWAPVIEKLRAHGPVKAPGKKPDPEVPTTHKAQTDSLNAGLAILSFLVPIVGWVLWGVWREQKPHAASTAAIIAWIGFAVTVIINIISIFS